MNNKGKEVNMSKSGEIHHPNDEFNEKTQKKEVKRLKHVYNTTDEQNILSSKTDELKSTTTRKLGSDEWQQQQLHDLRRGLGLPNMKRQADELGVDLRPRLTKELRAEATQKLGAQD